MLVGRRRRFLNYIQKKDLEGYRALIREPACAASRMADRRGRGTRARLHAQDSRGRAVHARAAARAHDGPRVLSIRVLAGLHRPALALQRGAARTSRPGRDALRRLMRRDVLADARSRSSSGSRSSSSRTSSPRARLARRSASITRVASRSVRSWSVDPDGDRALELKAPSPGDLPGANLIFDALAAERPRLRPAAAGRSRRPRPRHGPAGDRLRRLRVPVLRGLRGAAAEFEVASATSR